MISHGYFTRYLVYRYLSLVEKNRFDPRFDFRESSTPRIEGWRDSSRRKIHDFNGEEEGGERESGTRREGRDESSRLTRHRGRACLISARRTRCGASAFGPASGPVLSLHPFHPAINNGGMTTNTTMVIVSYVALRCGDGNEIEHPLLFSLLNDSLKRTRIFTIRENSTWSRPNLSKNPFRNGNNEEKEDRCDDLLELGMEIGRMV